MTGLALLGALVLFGPAAGVAVLTTTTLLGDLLGLLAAVGLAIGGGWRGDRDPLA